MNNDIYRWYDYKDGELKYMEFTMDDIRDDLNAQIEHTHGIILDAHFRMVLEEQNIIYRSLFVD